MKLIGSTRWNVYLGLLAMFPTLFSSYANNLLSTALIRSLIAFILFYIVAYMVRLFLSILIEPKNTLDSNEESKGTQVDWVTPEEDPFLPQPLDPKGPDSSDDFREMNPSELAKVIRTFTDK
jgi:hypothetical protein